MAAFFRRAASAAALIVLTAPVSAQWDPYPTPGVPLTPDGEPDLDGPPPRTFDGRPDLSGIWERLPSERGDTGGLQLGRAPNVDPPPGSPPLAHFFDIGAQFDVPYTEWGDRITQERIDDAARGNPDAYCLPMGPMQFHLHPQPRKIIQTRDLVVIVNEANSGIRQIFLDGRKLPEDPFPWWFGYSVGHWEGDTLVVESAGYRDDVWLDYNGSPLTSSGRIVERFRRPTFGRLEIDVTIEDPKAYTEPFTVRVNQEILLDTDLIEFVCIENEISSQNFYDSNEDD